MYCNKCGKEYYDEYDEVEYDEAEELVAEEVETEEVKVDDAKFEERKDYGKKPGYRPEPCHKCCKPFCKPEPICKEWDQEYICKFSAKCFPKKHCKHCRPCCGRK